jgi:hypothetical protein
MVLGYSALEKFPDCGCVTKKRAAGLESSPDPPGDSATGGGLPLGQGVSALTLEACDRAGRVLATAFEVNFGGSLQVRLPNQWGARTELDVAAGEPEGTAGDPRRPIQPDLVALELLLPFGVPRLPSR